MVLSVAHVVVPMKVRPDEKMPLGRNVQWPERPPKKTLTLTGGNELDRHERQPPALLAGDLVGLQ